MITEETITNITLSLQKIAQESTVVMRKAVLLKELRESTPQDLELFDLVLSFQISGILTTFAPKFNTIPFEDFDKHIVDWFDSGLGRSDFYHLPYSVQTLIFYMVSTDSLHLRAKDLVDVSFTYIDPYSWLASRVNSRSGDADDKCHFCGINDKVEDELCGVCKANIVTWADFRTEPFSVVLTQRLCTWTVLPKEDCGDFEFEYNNYHIQRVDGGPISYSIMTTLKEPYQASLPIAEYQRDT